MADKTIKLPEGHKWEEVPNSGAETIFQCLGCGATFTHDAIDDSTEFVEGDESCDE